MKLFLFLVLLSTAIFARKRPDTLRAPQITPPEELGPVKTINEQRKEIADDTFSPYIISGNAAYPGQFPWQALLIMDKEILCGGSLISKNFVLTAAHCLYGQTSVAVTLGNLQYPPEQGDSVHTFTTNNIIIHENYDNLVNDIGLVAVPTVTLSDNIAAVRLAPRSYQAESLVGSVVVASGFGKTSDAIQAVSDSLMYVSMMVMSNSECDSQFNVVHIKFDESVICTYGTSTNPTGSPCNGDSGGALIMKSADGVYTQVGIVSFGSSKGCALEYPAVYTRVSNYLDWIQQKTGIPIY